MFKPLNEAQFLADMLLVTSSRKEQNTRIQHMLMSATYDAFCVNYEKDGYAAPLFNHLASSFEPMKGEDLDAVLRWMTKFAPVFYSKKNDAFCIKKEVIDTLAIYALDDESARINRFWQWAVENGLANPTNHWYELVKSKKERIAQAYDESTAEKEVKALCARMTKHQLGDVASAVLKAFEVAKMERHAAA